MECLAWNPSGFDAAISAALAVLSRGGVLAAPTETVYGLMTPWHSAAGRERIYRMKARPTERRLQMLAASVAMAEECGLIADARLLRLAERFWPGPLTVVRPSTTGDTIGLRIPDHPFLAVLLAHFPEPLAATSANRSGCPPALTAAGAVADLAEMPDLLLDGGDLSVAGHGTASTVVDCTGVVPKILREGAISEADIRAALREKR